MQRSRYEGPTGIVGVLHDAVRRAGFPSASIWAPVPHYVATPPNPKATRAILDKLRRAARPRARPHRPRHRVERVGALGVGGRRRRRRRELVRRTARSALRHRRRRARVARTDDEIATTTTTKTTTTGSTRTTCRRASRSPKTSSATSATSPTTNVDDSRRFRREGRGRGAVPEAGRQDEGVDVDAFVVAVEHRRVVVERELAAEQAEAVRDRAVAAEEPRVGGADGEERHERGAFDELRRDAAHRVPQRRVGRRRRRLVLVERRDLDVRREVAERVGEHRSGCRRALGRAACGCRPRGRPGRG